jgi:HD domain
VIIFPPLVRLTTHTLHLAKRFFGSLSRREPEPADSMWAHSHLLPGELALWEQMDVADRRHAIGVARTTIDLMDDQATRPVLAAALLHDMGKIDSALGPVARAVATVVNRRTGDSRFARYRRHDQIGAALLEAAGSDPLTIAWAREHHLAPERWTIDRAIADALKAADDD